MKMKIGFDELWCVVPDGSGLWEWAEVELPSEQYERYRRIEREFEEMCEELGDLYAAEKKARRMKRRWIEV